MAAPSMSATAAARHDMSIKLKYWEVNTHHRLLFPTYHGRLLDASQIHACACA